MPFFISTYYSSQGSFFRISCCICSVHMTSHHSQLWSGSKRTRSWLPQHINWALLLSLIMADGWGFQCHQPEGRTTVGPVGGLASFPFSLPGFGREDFPHHLCMISRNHKVGLWQAELVEDDALRRASLCQGGKPGHQPLILVEKVPSRKVLPWVIGNGNAWSRNNFKILDVSHLSQANEVIFMQIGIWR